MTSVKIERDPEAAAAARHDVVVVGGGVYGVCVALEAAWRGRSVLLLERDDFGGAVSFSSLRILHGGLRYLQKMDLKRFFESVGERRWMLRHFPESTRVLPCLMPLYGDGVRRPAVFRAALPLNDLMSWRRNVGVAASHRLGRARVVSASEVARLFPGVDREGLRGGAWWVDGQMANSQRLTMELCRWASASGATLLNHVEATGLDVEGGRVAAVRAVDRVTGGELRFAAETVINAAGPWSAEVSASMGDAQPRLFRPTLAINVLLDRPPVGETAVAVTPKRPGAQTYFLHQEGGRLLGGTFYAPAPPAAVRDDPAAYGDVLRGMASAYLDEVNLAVPGLGLRPDEVLRVYDGLLPATAEGGDEPTDRPIVHDHGGAGGPGGLWSVSGVKWTTARLVAAQTLRRALPGAAATMTPRPAAVTGVAAEGSEVIEDRPWDAVRDAAHYLREHESAVTLDDLLLRRTAWARDPDVGRRLAERLAPELGVGDAALARAVAAIGRRPFAAEAAAA
ncbi:MAG: FAD-dependent oxidoreductase [Planctomycetota bacterium]